MKKIIIPTLMCCIAIFITNISYSQDIIILKTGDEIKSKVSEVTPDQIKYKKWDNLNGPIYSSAKSEVFMIKYANGTKDVFNTGTNQISNTSQTNNSNNGGKFIGTWYPKNYDGDNIKSTLEVTKPGDDYLVSYKKMERGGGYDFMYNVDGSFKEMGHVEGNSIVINSFIKLSLMNDNTILMASREFTKTPAFEQNKSTNTSTTTEPKIDFKGYYNNEYSVGDYKIVNDIVYYKSNSAKITNAIIDGSTQDSKGSDLKFNGNANLQCNMNIGGFKLVNNQHFYTFSLCLTYEDGTIINKTENIQGDGDGRDSFLFSYAYNLPHFGSNSGAPVVMFINFEIKDRYSDAIIQGFSKFTLLH